MTLDRADADVLAEALAAKFDERMDAAVQRLSAELEQGLGAVVERLCRRVDALERALAAAGIDVSSPSSH